MTTALRPPFPWRRFGTDFLYATLFNIGCALAITFVLVGGSFFNNLVGSVCIGTLAFVLIDGIRLLLWGAGRRPNWFGFLGVLLVSVPLAQFGGGALANWLLGYRMLRLETMFSTQATGMLMFTLLATVVATVIFSGRDNVIQAEARAARASARAEAIERQALQAQLQLLQAQIEPHMLFNTLANLQGLIGLDPARAQQMLDQLIQYLRVSLSSSRAAETTLAQEFALMDAYLGLMAVRMGARLRYTLTLPAALREARLPPMLLQPLVENAITHGLEPTIEGGCIEVCASAHDGMLQLTVSDNGRGLDAPSTPGTQIGLSNTRSRLAAIYGDRASVSLAAQAGGGALAQLNLPMATS